MLRKNIWLYLMCTVSLAVLAQNPNPSSSDGAMDGVNLQRTRNYPTVGIDQIKSVLWKTPKLFEINYAAALTMNFDGSSMNLANIGFSDPVMANGIIYFQLCISQKQNFILALNSQTGRTLWTFKSKEGISAPAIVGDTLFTVSGENCVYALDAGTGNEKWKFTSKNKSPSFSAYAAPAVQNGVLYFVSLKGELYAVDIESKQVRWIFQTKGFFTTPAFDSDTAYLTIDNVGVYAIDLATGREKWNFKTKGSLGTPIVSGEAVYFRTEEGVLYRLEAKTGQQQLSIKVGGKDRMVYPVTSVKIGTKLAIFEDTIFFGGEFNGISHLFAINAKTGEEKWKFKLPDPSRAPILAGNIVYVGGLGYFEAIDIKTGTIKWALEAKSEFKGKKISNVTSSPVVANKTVYFVTDEGIIYAIQ
jgi:eukaryotic-like serine/threonine-protein kinase